MSWTPNVLREFRKHLGGISQDELAERLGVSRATLVFWERKPSMLAVRLLDGLAEKTGFDPNEK